MSFHTVPPAKVPASLWVLAWASLAGQLVLLAEEGIRFDDEVSLLVSVLIGALLVGWISAGVVRARTVRLVLVFVVLALTVLVGVVGLIFSDSVADALWTLVALALSVTQLGALVRFRGTAWYAWQRGRPPTAEGPSITGLIAIAVVVGVLGGVVGSQVEDGFRLQVNVMGPR